MIQFFKCGLSILGTGARAFVALVGITGITAALANYAVTQGSGTNFGSIVVGAVHYAQHLLCDPTTPSQCAAVDSGGILSVKSSTLATAANQTTANNSLASIATNTAAAIPAQGNFTTNIGAVSILDSSSNALILDPCQGAVTTTPISISSAATSVIVAGTSSKKTYICGMMLFSAGTTNVGIVQGSGTTCGTSTLGLIGGATAGTGPNLTAQTGFNASPAGYHIAATTVNANDICLINGSAIQVSGYIATAVR